MTQASDPAPSLPESNQAKEAARTHLSKGWSALQQDHAEEALRHFEAALQAEPASALAQDGIVAALRIRLDGYRLFLNAAYKLADLSVIHRAGVIIAGAVLFKLFQGHPWGWPIAIVYVGFLILCFLGPPIVNIVLLIHPAGRRALRPDALLMARWCGLLLFGTVAGLTAGVLLKAAPYSYLALACFLLIRPIWVSYSFPPGSLARRRLGRYTMFMVALGAASPIVGAIDDGTGFWILAGLFAARFGHNVLAHSGAAYQRASPDRAPSRGEPPAG